MESLSPDDLSDINEYVEELIKRIGKKKCDEFIDSGMIANLIFYRWWNHEFINEREEMNFEKIKESFLVMFGQLVMTYPHMVEQMLSMRERYGEVLNLHPSIKCED